MSYKTVLAVTTGASPSAVQIDAAVAIARAEDAHLDVLSLGIDRIEMGYSFAGTSVVVHQEMLSRAKAEAEAANTWVRSRLAAEDIRWAAEPGVASVGVVGPVVGERARFCDLAVAPRPYGVESSADREAALEGALFNGGAPVLVVPDTGLAAGFADRIVLGWNRSEEAMHAARAALPFLRRAALVSIAVIDPPSLGLERSDPGGALSQWLARHGVRAEVAVLARTLPHLSEILARHCRDIDAGMVVMGAYSHSRFREAILGGMTRDMLEAVDTPLFMAH
ncbi:MAG: universal stress protein [Pseudomonadota bacterium]